MDGRLSGLEPAQPARSKGCVRAGSHTPPAAMHLLLARALVSPPRLRASWGAFSALPAESRQQALYGALRPSGAPFAPANPCALRGLIGPCWAANGYARLGHKNLCAHRS